jgi:hypothetical protein
LRETQAGSGYWSQSSFVHVFAKPVDRLRVRWPDGKISQVQVPADALHVVVDAAETVRRVK